MAWNELPSDEIIQKTAHALRENNIEVHIVDTGSQAMEQALSLIPKGSEVMTMTSETLDKLGIVKAINEGTDYNSARKRLTAMGDTQTSEKQKLGAAPDYTIGSVHAVTHDGKVLIASNTGSQLPAYAYGSRKVIWVVGTQKIVKNREEGMKRIEEYTLPLEDARAMKAYGEGSAINKMLILNKEVTKGRITIVFVKENIGF